MSKDFSGALEENSAPELEKMTECQYGDEVSGKPGRRSMTQKQAELIMAFIAMAWGSSYLLMKIGLEGIPPYSMVALRFLIAFLAVAAIFFPKLKYTTGRVLGVSSILGLFLFGIFAFLLHGMETTTASNAGFLIGSTVVIVPILNALLSKKIPENRIILGTLLTMAGIAFLSLQQSLSLGSGDLLCLTAAVVRASHIILTDRAAKEDDSLLIGIWQLAFAGLYGLIGTVLFETPALPGNTAEWAAIIGLALICGAFGFAAQPVAQKYTTPEHTALILSLEPVFSALFAFVFLQERLSGRGYIGAALVFCGVLAASVNRLPVGLKKHKNTAYAYAEEHK